METPLERVLARLGQVRSSNAGWTAQCPAHSDAENSLSVGVGADERVLLKCFAGCETGAIVAAVGLTVSDLFPARGTRKGQTARRHAPSPADSPPVPGFTPLHLVKSTKDSKGLATVKGDQGGNLTVVTPSQSPGLTLRGLAELKHLPEDFLRRLGLTVVQRGSGPAVRIPYYGTNGDLVAVRFRLAATGSRFVWRSGDKVALYGVDRLAAARAAGWVLLVEGESDCWTAWHYDMPAAGVPGKTTWRSEWTAELAGLDVFLWQEPDAEDFTRRVAADIPTLRVIGAPESIKDLSELHLQGHDVRARLEELKAHAIPAGDLQRHAADAALAALREQAQEILAIPDPLVRVRTALRALGYGGELGPPLLTYLAASSRLLAMRHGATPVHVLIVGVPSAGKSYTLRSVLTLLPAAAYHIIDAGSPRVLIYDSAELTHRAVVFSEADSLPGGEDNPAASAIRNLLQDHALHYKTTIRNPEGGGYTVHEIAKPGPTVLLTTAVRRLGPQLDSRLFALEVPDDDHQVRAALAAQATIELSDPGEPDAALIAYQALLQAQAPWTVVVPFVEELSRAISRSIAAPRIVRDFGRLLSLVKTVAVLRHAHRTRDDRGRVVATLEDYQTVYALVRDSYEASASGASDAMRATVEAVQRLLEITDKKTVSVTELGKELGISKTAAGHRAKMAQRHGWLVNAETRRGYPAQLSLGEPLPEQSGLPEPETLLLYRQGVRTVTAGLPAGLTAQAADIPALSAGCNGVNPETGEITGDACGAETDASAVHSEICECPVCLPPTEVEI